MSFCEGAYSPVVALSSRLDPGWAKRVADVGGMSARPLAGHALTIEEARVRSKDAYRHYYRDIRELVPKERLLEFNLKDGWEPLCKFLEKPVPVSDVRLMYCGSADDIQAVPFPHENDKQANQQFFVEFSRIAQGHILKNVLSFAAVVMVPLSMLYYFYRQ